ncbi:MAG TPA: AraC family transcriptional regulator [Bacillales bacterium]|nr:AraC family transcriptional regulator [Bacillales bacterium]
MKPVDTHDSHFILHAKSKTHHFEGEGALSLKTFANGRAFYEAGGGCYAVDETRYLLLNPGRYAITIEDEREVESFCLFFKDGFAGEVHDAVASTAEQGLDDPFRPPSKEIEWVQKTYPNDTCLMMLLRRLKTERNDEVRRDELMHDIMRRMLVIHMETKKEIERLPAMRPAVREEIYRRVATAHDFLEACYAQPLTLDTIAQTACLSANHLLKNYKAVHGKSPSQQLSEIRMREAKRLLADEDIAVTDIAFAVGFETASAFSKKFRRHTGCAPSVFRKKVRLDKPPRSR